MTPEEQILRRALAASTLRSDEWNKIQADLRNRAFFSARVTEARFLADARAQIAELAAGRRSASEIRRDLRDTLSKLGYKPPAGPDAKKHGGMLDLRSQTRLDTIIQTNADQARGYVQWREGMDGTTLEAFPAQELVRYEYRKEPRDWEKIWRGHGGTFSRTGRMIALKASGIWKSISRFGNPWPPFDFGSGMGVLDVSYEEAVAEGIIPEGEPVKVPKDLPGMNDGLGVQVPFRHDSDEWANLEDTFGDQIRYANGFVEWRGSALGAMARGDADAPKKFRLGKFRETMLSKLSAAARSALEGQGFTVQEGFVRHNAKHFSDKGGDRLPLESGDFDLLPWIVADPTSVEEREDEVLLRFDSMDGSMLELGISYADGIPTPTTFHKRKATP